MNSPSRQAGKLNAREICILSLMAALIFSTKLALASLPNVNLNSVLIILTVVFFGWKALYTVYVYVMLEGLVFGFSIYWFSYLYAWPILVLVAMLFRKNESTVIWAVIAAIYGLCFGPIMYILYFIVNGWHLVFSMWVAGIPYDLVHCISNFILTLVLYKPLYKVMDKLVNGKVSTS